MLLCISKITVIEKETDSLGGRKYCPILQEQLKGNHRFHDRVGRRDSPQSSAEPVGTTGHGHPEKRRNVPGNRQDFFGFTVPQRASELTAAKLTIGSAPVLHI